jgi:hypothetical protein
MTEFKTIFVDGTTKTPEIDFNYLTGDLVLYGRSIPENAAKVYDPLVNWINSYIITPQDITNLHLKLEYFNSASLIWITKIIKLLSKIEKKDSVLYINLYIENDDIDIKEADELKDIICSIFDNLDSLKVSIGIKIHGIDSNGKVVDESTIML